MTVLTVIKLEAMEQGSRPERVFLPITQGNNDLSVTNANPRNFMYKATPVGDMIAGNNFYCGFVGNLALGWLQHCDNLYGQWGSAPEW